MQAEQPRRTNKPRARRELYHATQGAHPRQDIPIEETLWDPSANAGTAELTVVSNHNASIVSLQRADLTDWQRG
jgi:hypothetical protein